MTNRTDNFTRADSTTSLGTPSDGGSAWVASSGTWGIDTNKGYKSANSGSLQDTAYLESSASDGDVQATISANDNANGGGLIFRYTDDNNYWIAIAAEASPTLYERNGGSFFLRATGTSATANGTYKATLLGTAISLSKDGAAPYISYTSSFNQAATKHGLRSAGITPRFTAYDAPGPSAGGAKPWYYQYMGAVNSV